MRKEIESILFEGRAKQHAIHGIFRCQCLVCTIALTLTVATVATIATIAIAAILFQFFVCHDQGFVGLKAASQHLCIGRWTALKQMNG